MTTRIVLGSVSGGLLFGAGVFGVAGALATPWLFIPAGALTLASGVVFIVRSAVTRVARLPSGPGDAPRIGIGADVHATARIEPGAVIEMGATLEAGAVVRSGALVRMGATVGRNARVEPGAVVGWGATVGDGAVLERDASLGAGATLHAGARLGEGQHAGAGSDVRAHLEAGSRSAAALPEPASATPGDDRAQRIDDLCDRLEAELREGSDALRSFLTTTGGSVATLRATCHELLRRERLLRQEVEPEHLERLERERQALRERIAGARDEQVRAAFEHALLALEDQQAQRQRLAQSAERLEAELARLLWSIEGAIAQLVHARAAGAAVRAPTQDEGLERLRDELTAVTEALESVDQEEREALRHPAGRQPIRS